MITDLSDDAMVSSAGFLKDFSKGGKCFCFPPEVWERDVWQGFDHRLAARILNAMGHLLKDGDRLDKQIRFGLGRLRVFAVKESLLLEPEEMTSKIMDDLDLRKHLESLT